MGYTAKSSLSKPCPDCGGVLSRQTVDPAKPLGMVKCANCAFSSPIAEYAASVQDAARVKAQARKDEV